MHIRIKHTFDKINSDGVRQVIASFTEYKKNFYAEF